MEKQIKVVIAIGQLQQMIAQIEKEYEPVKERYKGKEDIKTGVFEFLQVEENAALCLSPYKELNCGVENAPSSFSDCVECGK